MRIDGRLRLTNNEGDARRANAIYTLMVSVVVKSRDDCEWLGSERCEGLPIDKLKAKIHGRRVPSKLSAERHQSDRRAIYLQHML